MSKPEVYMFREGFWASIISDSYTFAMLCGSVWFNYAFVGGSHFLNAVILVMLMVMLIGKAGSYKSVFHSREALIEHLREGK